MSNYDSGPKKVRFMTPPNTLKQKVGSGGLDPLVIARSQDIIDSFEIDFMPYAQRYLEQLEAHTTKAIESNDNSPELKGKISVPVMELKANGGMFHYELLSDVANIALRFLDAIDELNKDALEVIKAHETTIKIIIKNDLKGDGGKEGDALINELDKACRRYFSKHPPKK